MLSRLGGLLYLTWREFFISSYRSTLSHRVTAYCGGAVVQLYEDLDLIMALESDVLCVVSSHRRFPTG
jgi:hypothetical protein